MTESQDPNTPVELRASDADRERAAERLREAAADGRITMDELEERVDAVYSARTHAELRLLIRDLAAPDVPVSAPAAPKPAEVIPTRKSRRRSLVVMSGLDRRGRWVVPGRFSVFAFWGGAQLDLREAVLTERETVIRVDAVMSGIEIIVPKDAVVLVEGSGVLGVFAEAASTDVPPPGAPVIRIVGISFWAGVSVTRTPTYVPKKQRRALADAATEDRPALESVERDT
ncbi:DUF1707 and DUF2154 domain-containing protein [Actinospica durhamensis]|uniref:DUF1707 and DUF2154 domain-containing protein n=1 Tax=Actinospica durhamensis TaxID=1508375 RepID=A0A941ENT4_9ACTN|nr:DUF1707 domain-containing protein [Actinospica durhamensis]MBR7834456.1 DUF1707 and DUF2154 domain-containing protein [Actinospica durhamensis]